MRHSNVRQVALRRVSLETSGNYRCEVTSKNSPGFDSQFEEGKMVVLGECCSTIQILINRSEIDISSLGECNINQVLTAFRDFF